MWYFSKPLFFLFFFFFFCLPVNFYQRRIAAIWFLGPWFYRLGTQRSFRCSGCARIINLSFVLNPTSLFSSSSLLWLDSRQEEAGNHLLAELADAEAIHALPLKMEKGI